MFLRHRLASESVDCRASLAMTECALAMTGRALAMTGRALAMTECALATTGRALAMTECALATTGRALAMTASVAAMGRTCHREAAGRGDLSLLQLGRGLPRFARNDGMRARNDGICARHDSVCSRNGADLSSRGRRPWRSIAATARAWIAALRSQ
jgi:hypothetical protein